MTLIYSVVARGSTVLAEWSENVGNFATITRMLLTKMIQQNAAESHQLSTPAPSSKSPAMISFLYDGRYVFHCLEPPNSLLRFLVMAEKSVGVKIPYRFLDELSREFMASYGTTMPQRVVALAYLDSFGPTMKAIQAKYNKLITSGVEDISPPEIKRVREQIDHIQNVMVENIDKILARAEKIELLVDKADSISSNTVEFRRQAQQLHRMMWWRQKKLILMVCGALGAVGTLLVSLEFGFPFKF
eukprot:Protomagalhaensia_sp_Gyna_25__2616@NODE_248_length_4190_cov_66_562997_g191_i0_p2_GENE_NODE_248_length_4190_cov_66_562997_g191_i0NODE_248_length_4190_cov_66_562997_g191_i0_p2_ORF_typecomplete_len244_score47_05Synaptobrevin/PF00957_21/1_1e23Longin/PF13774_6/3e08RRF/PF01765_19/0_025Shikimate_dh_N/PF08501_11/0_34Peptidase_S49/PF01343_18/0_19_NODE_248_length_4190_cov_66_562997_g191_i028703601